MKSNFKSLKKLEEFLIKVQIFKVINFKLNESCLGDNFDKLIAKYGYKLDNKEVFDRFSNDGYGTVIRTDKITYQIKLKKNEAK
jgi:hypothetical protein